MLLMKIRKRLTTPSITRTLQLSLFAFIILIWLLLLAASYFSITHEVDEDYDGQLSQMARIILAFPNYHFNQQTTKADKNTGKNNDTAPIVTLPPYQGKDNYEEYLSFQVFNQNELIMRSSNAPNKRFALTNNTFSDVQVDGEKYRVYSLTPSDSPLTVVTAQSYKLREQTTGELLEYFWLFLLITLPFVLWLSTYLINRGLAPLHEINHELKHRSPNNLSQISINTPPEELKAILNSLNSLFSDLKNSFETQKKFTADAAHELRTPLAGLKAQAQIAIQNPERTQASLIRIIESVDRCSRLTEQLLSLARLDGKKDVSLSTFKSGDLLKLVWQDLNRDDQFIIQYQGDLTTTITSDKNLCYVLFRNLFENARRYSPSGSIVTARVLSADNQLQVEIIDQGRGISPDKLEQVFSRFYRENTVPVENNSVCNQNKVGSGLGLSIVKTITELLDIDIELINNTPEKGVTATVRFRLA